MLHFLIILPMVLLLACACLWNAIIKLGRFVRVKDMEISAYREAVGQRDAMITELQRKVENYERPEVIAAIQRAMAAYQ